MSDTQHNPAAGWPTMQQPGHTPPPGYPYLPPQPQPEPRNGFGITALSLAIPGLLLGLIPLTGFVAVILGALALIFGFCGLGRVRRRRATNKVMTWFGIVLGALALILGVIGIVIVASAVEELDEDLEEIGEEWERDVDELEREMEQLGQ